MYQGHNDNDFIKSKYSAGNYRFPAIDGNKWIYFSFVEQKPKTQVWDVVNKTSEEPLARIEWYTHWRQYVVYPEPNTLFNCGCLDTINDFIKRLNKEKSIKA